VTDRDGAGATLVECRNLTRRYQRGTDAATVTAVSDVNLVVPRGAVATISGPSGSGKSTLLHLIGSLDAPTSGEVRFAGTSLQTCSDRELATLRRQRIGFVFQRFHLLARLRAWENVAMPLLLDGTAPAEARRRALALLGDVGLDDRVDHLPSELSGGEMQRVVVARALVNEPELILADEPTGSLDSATGQEVMALLVELVGTHATTLLVVTHDAAIASLGDLHLRMKDGRLEPGAGSAANRTAPPSDGA
jgi:putative ABC transport system ATP-binding protein